MQKVKRIYKDRFYITEHIPGISGFQRWNEREYRVCTGLKASKSSRAYVIKEFKENGLGKFRLENGRVIEHQPNVEEKEVVGWLRDNPYQSAYIVNPEVYSLQLRI